MRQVRGTPTDETWPGARTLPDFSKISFPLMVPPPLASLFPTATDPARSLADSLLALDPARRPVAQAALAHSYFFTDPIAVEPWELRPRPPSRDSPRFIVPVREPDKKKGRAKLVGPEALAITDVRVLFPS
jgi:serine/threonine protein kinase